MGIIRSNHGVKKEMADGVGSRGRSQFLPTPGILASNRVVYQFLALPLTSFACSSPNPKPFLPKRSKKVSFKYPNPLTSLLQFTSSLPVPVPVSYLSATDMGLTSGDYHPSHSGGNESSDSSYSDDHHLQTHSSLHSQLSLPTVPSLTSHHPYNYFLSNYLPYHCLNTLQGHTSYVCSLTIAGNFLYSGSSDTEIRSWRLDTPDDHDNNVVAQGKGTVKSLVVLEDKLFSAHQDHKIRVWKISDNHKFQRLATLPTLGDRASKILSPGNQVQVRRHKTSTWVHHVDTVAALAVSSDESLLYSVSWDRTLKIWRTSDFKCLESVTNAHDDAINAVASSSSSEDGEVVYTGSADKKIKVWKMQNNQGGGGGENNKRGKYSLVETLEKHNSGINALALSQDGSVLYSGACDRSILVWAKNEEGSLVVMGALRGHTESILCLFVVSDLVCSGSADKTVRVWRGIEGKYSCLSVLEGHGGPIKCLTATVDRCNSLEESYYVYSGSLDCDIKVWQIRVPVL